MFYNTKLRFLPYFLDLNFDHFPNIQQIKHLMGHFLMLNTGKCPCIKVNLPPIAIYHLLDCNWVDPLYVISLVIEQYQSVSRLKVQGRLQLSLFSPYCRRLSCKACTAPVSPSPTSEDGGALPVLSPRATRPLPRKGAPLPAGGGLWLCRRD